MKRFEVMGYDILLIRLQDRFYALDCMCTHSFGDLSKGSLDVDEKRVICPNHGGTFDITDGQVVAGLPSFPLQVYEVHVVGDDIVLTFVY